MVADPVAVLVKYIEPPYSAGTVLNWIAPIMVPGVTRLKPPIEPVSAKVPVEKVYQCTGLTAQFPGVCVVTNVGVCVAP